MYKVYVAPYRTPTHITLLGTRDEWIRILDYFTKSHKSSYALLIKQSLASSTGESINIQMLQPTAKAILRELGLSA